MLLILIHSFLISFIGHYISSYHTAIGNEILSSLQATSDDARQELGVRTKRDATIQPQLEVVKQEYYRVHRVLSRV